MFLLEMTEIMDIIFQWCSLMLIQTLYGMVTLWDGIYQITWKNHALLFMQGVFPNFSNNPLILRPYHSNEGIERPHLFNESCWRYFWQKDGSSCGVIALIMVASVVIKPEYILEIAFQSTFYINFDPCHCNVLKKILQRYWWLRIIIVLFTLFCLPYRFVNLVCFHCF